MERVWAHADEFRGSAEASHRNLRLRPGVNSDDQEDGGAGEAPSTACERAVTSSETVEGTLDSLAV